MGIFNKAIPQYTVDPISNAISPIVPEEQPAKVDDIFDPLFNAEVRARLRDTYGNSPLATFEGYAEMLKNAWGQGDSLLGKGMGVLSTFGRSMDKADDFIIGGLTEGVKGVTGQGIENPLHNIFVEDQDYTGQKLLAATANSMRGLSGVTLDEDDFNGIWKVPSLGLELATDPGIAGGMLARNLAPEAAKLTTSDLLKNISSQTASAKLGYAGQLLSEYDDFMGKLAIDATAPGLRQTWNSVLKPKFAQWFAINSPEDYANAERDMEIITDPDAPPEAKFEAAKRIAENEGAVEYIDRLKEVDDKFDEADAMLAKQRNTTPAASSVDTINNPVQLQMDVSSSLESQPVKEIGAPNSEAWIPQDVNEYYSGPVDFVDPDVAALLQVNEAPDYILDPKTFDDAIRIANDTNYVTKAKAYKELRLRQAKEFAATKAEFKTKVTEAEQQKLDAIRKLENIVDSRSKGLAFIEDDLTFDKDKVDEIRKAVIDHFRLEPSLGSPNPYHYHQRNLDDINSRLQSIPDLKGFETENGGVIDLSYANIRDILHGRTDLYKGGPLSAFIREYNPKASFESSLPETKSKWIVSNSQRGFVNDDLLDKGTEYARKSLAINLSDQIAKGTVRRFHDFYSCKAAIFDMLRGFDDNLSDLPRGLGYRTTKVLENGKVASIETSAEQVMERYATAIASVLYPSRKKNFYEIFKGIESSIDEMQSLAEHLQVDSKMLAVDPLKAFKQLPKEKQTPEAYARILEFRKNNALLRKRATLIESVTDWADSVKKEFLDPVREYIPAGYNGIKYDGVTDISKELDVNDKLDVGSTVSRMLSNLGYEDGVKAIRESGINKYYQIIVPDDAEIPMTYWHMNDTAHNGTARTLDNMYTWYKRAKSGLEQYYAAKNDWLKHKDKWLDSHPDWVKDHGTDFPIFNKEIREQYSINSKTAPGLMDLLGIDVKYKGEIYKEGARTPTDLRRSFTGVLLHSDHFLDEQEFARNIVNLDLRMPYIESEIPKSAAETALRNITFGSLTESAEDANKAYEAVLDTVTRLPSRDLAEATVGKALLPVNGAIDNALDSVAPDVTAYIKNGGSLDRAKAYLDPEQVDMFESMQDAIAPMETTIGRVTPPDPPVPPVTPTPETPKAPKPRKRVIDVRKKVAESVEQQFEGSSRITTQHEIASLLNDIKRDMTVDPTTKEASKLAGKEGFKAVNRYRKAIAKAYGDVVQGTDFWRSLRQSGWQRASVENSAEWLPNLRKALTDNVNKINQACGGEVVKLIDTKGKEFTTIGVTFNTENSKILELINAHADDLAKLELSDVIYTPARRLSKSDVAFLKTDTAQTIDRYRARTQELVNRMYNTLGLKSVDDARLKNTLNHSDETLDKVANLFYNGNAAAANDFDELVYKITNLDAYRKVDRGVFDTISPERRIRGDFWNFDSSEDGYLFTNNLYDIVKRTFTEGAFANTKFQAYAGIFANKNWSPAEYGIKTVEDLEAVFKATTHGGKLSGNFANLSLLAPQFDESGKLVKFKQFDKTTRKGLQEALDNPRTVLIPSNAVAFLDSALKKEARMSNGLFQFINKHFTIPFKFGVLSNPGFVIGNVGDATYKQMQTMAAKYGTSVTEEFNNVRKCLTDIVNLKNDYYDIFDVYVAAVKDKKIYSSELEIPKVIKIKPEELIPDIVASDAKYQTNFIVWLENNLVDEHLVPIPNPLGSRAADVFRQYATLKKMVKNSTTFQDVNINEALGKTGKFNLERTGIDRVLQGSTKYDPKDFKTWGLFMNNPKMRAVMESSEWIEDNFRTACILNDIRHRNWYFEDYQALLNPELEKRLAEDPDVVKMAQMFKEEMLNDLDTATNTMFAANFDYDKSSDFGEAVGKAIPFPTFFMKNFYYWIDLWLNHPQYVDNVLKVQEGLWRGRNTSKDQFVADAKGRGAIPIGGQSQMLPDWFKGYFKPSPLQSMFGAFSLMNSPASDLSYRLHPLASGALSGVGLTTSNPDEIKYRPYSTNPYEKNIKKGDPNFNAVNYTIHKANPKEREINTAIRLPNRIKSKQAQMSDFLPSIFQPDYSKK